MKDVPLNSLKGYFGHTLGASGLLETIVGMHSLATKTHCLRLWVFQNWEFRTQLSM